MHEELTSTESSDSPTSLSALPQAYMNNAFNESIDVTMLQMPFQPVADDSLDIRPFQQADNSKVSIDGARQASITQLCSFKSINWATEILCMTSDHPGHTLTMVS